jgi:dihydroxyacid dehydratase/phosphogluconate dehydratase
MGLTREQIHQPLVGVASCWNEAAPCNISLMRQAQAVKKGVAAANGTPREFCTITVTDGIVKSSPIRWNSRCAGTVMTRWLASLAATSLCRA